MHKNTHLFGVMLAAALVLFACVISASASRLAFSNQNFRQTFPSLEFEVGAALISCTATIEGSFHSRTIAKVLESLIGYVSRATIGTCIGGSARFLPERLPWHIRYNGFSGTLPSITRIHLRYINMGFLIRTELLTCLFLTVPNQPARSWLNREAGGNVTTLRFDETAQLEDFENCPGVVARLREPSSAERASSVTVLGATTRIAVTLVP